MSSHTATKLPAILALTLALLSPVQLMLADMAVPDFAMDKQTRIDKLILTYGKESQDFRSRHIEYQLKRYWRNRYLLDAHITFNNGETADMQFMLAFWPWNTYSVNFLQDKIISQSKYFDLPERHILFDAGTENFSVFIENDKLYCYIQISNQALQCVDVNQKQTAPESQAGSTARGL